MRITTLVIFFIFILSGTRAQNKITKNEHTEVFITDVFLKLTEIELNEKIRKELLKNNKVIIDNEIEKTLDLDTINNSISIQSCFIGSMTTPCDNYFITSYLLKGDIYEIVYSSNSTSSADKHQNALQLFQYNLKTRILTRDTIDHKAFRLTLKDFFKDNTPNNILSKYSENVNPIYWFNGNRIFCTISDTGYSNTLLKETYLRGSTIEIKWNGANFIIAKYILGEFDTKIKEE